MKKIIIAALVIAATGITALSVGKTSEVKTVKVTKVEKADFITGGFSSHKADIGSAD